MQRPHGRLGLGLLAVASAVLLLITAGCSAKPAGETASDQPIAVGSILDATGPLNVLGKPNIDATKLAVKDINDSGGLLGRQLKLISYDSQSDNAMYTQYANKLTLENKVSVLMGGITSASREAIRPIADRSKTLYFYNQLYEGGVCDKNVFNTGPVPSQQLAPLIPYAAQHFGKKMYIVAADYNFGHISAGWVKKYAEQAGAKIVGEEYIPLESSEFGPVINKLQAAKPDVVVSLLVGGNHAAFYRLFSSTGLNTSMKIVSSTFGDGSEHIVLAPNESKGITVAFPYFQELKSPANEAFTAKWHAAYGSDYPYVANSGVTVYNGWMLWAAAVRQAGSLDRDKVIAALESGLSIDTPSGKVSLDPGSHHVTQNVTIAEANDQHGFKILETEANVPPAFEKSVCDLQKNPNTNKQFLP
ncbi:urea ABC transporter substrate-binding protein [Dactylosporangium darangshiense]|uniref:Urea ABC transporter substrate-binding protein n=1 Tax=Dactylosporangium darangshiense TaxID=579108 RepID=A0ABP8DTV0_9ACTN